jgi:4-hydroxy-tetrahydrodipicolinate synthase
MRGVWTAIITPFTDSGELDLPSLKKILRDQVEAGISGIIPCGTTGEAPTLSLDEKKMLIQTCLQELKGSPVKVVAGTGSNNTRDTVEFSKWASSAGVDGVLLVTPYYNKPSQAGMEEHFKSVASVIDCEVILYNVPSRTGVSLTAETVGRLASHPRIRTIKEATGNPALSSEILDQVSKSGQSIDILSGDDATYLPLLSIGAVGIISVASNLFPREMVALQKAFDEGDLKKALKIHQKHFPLFRDLFIESNPVPIKAAMASLDWCRPDVRLPLSPLQPAHLKKLEASLSEYQIVRGKS